MLRPKVTAAQYRQYMATLAAPHEIDVTVLLLAPDHTVIDDISDTLLDGQVDVTAPKYNDGDIEVSRTVALQLLDPKRTLALDSGSPAAGAFYMDRMVRVIYSVRCPFGWVNVPVFTGPVVDVSRDGDIVDVECHGKERYALGATMKTMTLRGRRGDAMRTLMAQSGESGKYMDFPDSKITLSKPFSVGKKDSWWAKTWRINASMNRILFYDGRGVAQSRPKPTKTAMTLRADDNGMLLADPEVTYSIDDLRNCVHMKGAPAKKGKPTPWWQEPAPSNHPLSPKRLGRNGRSLFFTEFVENSDLKSEAACRKLAKSTLSDLLMQQVEVSVESLPIPHLEPWDVLQIVATGLSVRMRVSSFSLPLVQKEGEGTPMTIGSLRNLSKPRRRRKARR